MQSGLREEGFGKQKSIFWNSEIGYEKETRIKSIWTTTNIRCNCNCLKICKRLAQEPVPQTISQDIQNPRNSGNEQLCALEETAQKSSTSPDCLLTLSEKDEMKKSNYESDPEIRDGVTNSTVEFTATTDQVVTVVRVTKTIKRTSEKLQQESSVRKSRFSDFPEVFSSEIDQSTCPQISSSLEVGFQKESLITKDQIAVISSDDISDDSVLSVTPIDRPLVTTSKSRKSLLDVLTSASAHCLDFKETLRKEKFSKICKWRTALAKQISVNELQSFLSEKDVFFENVEQV